MLSSQRHFLLQDGRPVGSDASASRVNPQQTPVITVDQPLYALSKQIQWNCPQTFGEHQFVFVLGGLHIELAGLKTLGDWLDGSGWTTALQNGNIASSGKAEADLHASHITRARHAHQVTAACLYILQHKAYSNYISTVDNELPLPEFDTWLGCARDLPARDRDVQS